MIPLSAPPLIIKPLIVLPVVAPVIAPLRFKVVTPDTAPPAVMFNPAEVTAKVPVELPIIVLAVPVELRSTEPVAVNPPVIVAPLVMVAPPLKVLKPLTPRVPPRVVLPDPTDNVFAPETDVFPFRVTFPVPVVKVPVPVCDRFPLFPIATLLLKVLAAVKVFAWFKYATLLRVPAVLMLAPFSVKAVVALTVAP